MGFCFYITGQPVSSPYPAGGSQGGGKPMQPTAPQAAVSAAQHALNQAMKATQGPPQQQSVGGKPMPGQQHPGQPGVPPGAMGGKPMAMGQPPGQQRGMNPSSAVSAGMMQHPNQNVSMQSTPGQVSDLNCCVEIFDK